MNYIVWIFGRGASIASGLNWAVPESLCSSTRNIQEEKIKSELLAEMEQLLGNPERPRPYKLLLAQLSSRTSPGWQHFFLTTNWDTLLQREIGVLGLGKAPDWLRETHVFHLNGAVDGLPESGEIPLRSPFLLETDAASQRSPSLEFDRALQFIFWRRVFVVVGMSFSCPTDRGLLSVLRSVEDDLPVGSAWWLVINRDPESAKETAGRIAAALPKALVTYVASPFEEWVANGTPELAKANILQAPNVCGNDFQTMIDI